MIIKLIGAATIISVGIVIGNSLYYIFSERIKILERFMSFVIFCESEIEYYKTEMNDIIEKFINNQSKYDDLIFKKDKKTFYITNDNKKIIDLFFTDILTLDSDTQKYFFSKTKNDLTIALNNAKNDLTVKGKMFKKLIPIASIGIVILIL